MTHEVIRHLLDDYVTGELNEDARAAVADHVAVCEICAGEVGSLQRIFARAADLPKSIEPPGEAWSNIRNAIMREENAVASRHTATGVAFWRRPWVMAAAAAVVVAVLSSATTALYLNSRSHSASTPGGLPGFTDSTPATLAAFTAEENNYLRQAAMLQDLLDQQQTALAPETIAQLKASLRTIDEAISEARSALLRDPSNKLLIEMLSANYKQKVDLLRRSTEMTRGT